MLSDDQNLDFSAHERGLALRQSARDHEEGWVEACLEAALEDPHPFVRSEGAVALNDAPDSDVIPALARILASDVPAVQRWRAERLLIRRDPERALPVLQIELESGEGPRRRRAIEALGRLGNLAFPLIERSSSHEDPAIRRRVAKALVSLEARECNAVLLSLLRDHDLGVRLAALRALARLTERPGGLIEPAEFNRPVLNRLTRGTPEEQVLALRIVARFGGAVEDSDLDFDELFGLVEREPTALLPALELVARSRSPEDFENLVSRKEPRYGLAAVLALAGIEAMPRRFAPFLEHDDPKVRSVAVRGIASEPDDPWVRAELERAYGDEDEGVRWLARRAMTGALDRRRTMLTRGRLPAEGASAKWPFGLPPPEEGAGVLDRLPLAVGTVNLSYNLNLGVLVRAAEAAGAREVLVAGRDFYHRIAAMGTDRHVDVRFFDSTEALVDHTRSSGYQLVAVQQSPGAERFDLADYPPRPCLLLGSEGPGLPPELCARADMVVEIPQRGQIDSLNVSCAASLVLWACLARRGWL